jgi:hypothetical protein
MSTGHPYGFLYRVAFDACLNVSKTYGDTLRPMATLGVEEWVASELVRLEASPDLTDFGRCAISDLRDIKAALDLWHAVLYEKTAIVPRVVSREDVEKARDWLLVTFDSLEGNGTQNCFWCPSDEDAARCLVRATEPLVKSDLEGVVL